MPCLCCSRLGAAGGLVRALYRHLAGPRWRHNRSRWCVPRAAVVSALLAGGASADTQDTDGRTALMKAALEGHDATVTALLAGGASLDAQDTNGSGRTALWAASSQGHDATVTALLAAGASVDTQDSAGQTALMCYRHPGDGGNSFANSALDSGPCGHSHLISTKR